VAETPHPTDVEVSRSLNAVVATLNDRRADEAKIDELQSIVTGVLGGEARILVRRGADVAAELTDRDGKVLATVARDGGHWVGTRVGPPLSGGYVPSAGGT
jgi:hypothetical protein